MAQSGLRGLRDSGLIILSFITFDGFVDFYFILRKKHKKNVYFKIDLKQLEQHIGCNKVQGGQTVLNSRGGKMVRI